MRIGLEKKKREQNDGAYKRQTWFHLLVIRFIFAIIYQLVTQQWSGGETQLRSPLSWQYRMSTEFRLGLCRLQIPVRKMKTLHHSFCDPPLFNIYYALIISAMVSFYSSSSLTFS